MVENGPGGPFSTAKNGPGGGPFYRGGVHFQRVKMDRGVHFQRVKMDRGSISNGGPFSISHRPGETWVCCVMCSKWAHWQCSPNDDKMYVCDDCNPDS